MNRPKNRFSLILCTLFFLSQHTIIQALDAEFDIFDDHAFDIFSNQALNELLETSHFTVNKQVDVPGIIEILDDLGVTNLLQEDFFKRTSQLNKRSLLDSPLYRADKQYSYHNWITSFQFFFEQMRTSHFSQKGTGINSYLALTEPTIIEKLNTSMEKVQALFPSFDIDLIRALALFKNGTIQQRRIGAMIQCTRRFRWFKTWFKIPLLYQEHNYFLTEAEQQAIEEEFGAVDPEEQERFIREHLVSDKLGFGDARLGLERRIYKQGNLTINGGLYTTLPCAFSFKNGIYGSYFPPLHKRPSFDLAKIVELGTEPETQEQAVITANDFFLKVLDNLSAMVLECPLGNNGHPGFGIFMRNTTPLSFFIPRPWARTITLKSFMSLEYLIAGRKKQFFIEKNNAQEFEEREFQDNDEEALNNLAFLNKQFIDKFVPFTLEITRKPGIIFVWTSKFTYKKKYWGLHFGSDLWVQSRPHMTNISAQICQHNRINLEKARGFWAYQNRLIGTLYWKAKRRNKDLLISLNIAETTQSSGIGEEWMFSLNIETNF